jgi:hypothetical protein
MQVNEKKYSIISLVFSKGLMLYSFLFSVFFSAQIFVSKKSVLHIFDGADVTINGKSFDNGSHKIEDSVKVYVAEGTVLSNWDNDNIEIIPVLKNEKRLASPKKLVSRNTIDKIPKVSKDYKANIAEHISNPFKGLEFISSGKVLASCSLTPTVYLPMFSKVYSYAILVREYVYQKATEHNDNYYTRLSLEAHSTRPPPFQYKLKTPVLLILITI